MTDFKDLPIGAQFIYIGDAPLYEKLSDTLVGAVDTGAAFNMEIHEMAMPVREVEND